MAVAHPEVYILNCSLNAPHPYIRTYYGRMYEMCIRDSEYADDIIAGADKRAFLMEHAKVILDDKAIESLAQL